MAYKMLPVSDETAAQLYKLVPGLEEAPVEEKAECLCRHFREIARRDREDKLTLSRLELHNFNADEPRDSRGRWTTDGATESSDNGKYEVCFATGTMVLMADGSMKVIEKVEAGEMVLAAPEADPEATPTACPVAEVYHNAPARLVALAIASLADPLHGEVIRTTAGHPFYVKERGWTKAKDLKKKDKLRTADGNWTNVLLLTETGKIEPVFNLHIRDTGTYFVGLRGTGTALLVHNQSVEEPDDAEPEDEEDRPENSGLRYRHFNMTPAEEAEAAREDEKYMASKYDDLVRRWQAGVITDGEMDELDQHFRAQAAQLRNVRPGSPVQASTEYWQAVEVAIKQRYGTTPPDGNDPQTWAMEQSVHSPVSREDVAKIYDRAAQRVEAQQREGLADADAVAQYRDCQAQGMYRTRYEAARAIQGKPPLPGDWDAHHRIPQMYKENPEFKNFDFDNPSNIQGIQGSRGCQQCPSESNE